MPRTKRKHKLRPCVVIPGRLWDLQAFQLYAGVGRQVIEQARKSGQVKAREVGQRILYSTDEFIAWVMGNGTKPKDGAQ